MGPEKRKTKPSQKEKELECLLFSELQEKKKVFYTVDTKGDIGSPQAAWSDDDDNATVVSLVATNRLKKLRRTHDEIKITAKDFSERLREHFTKTEPPQKWSAHVEEEEKDISPILAWGGKLLKRPLHMLPRDVLSVSRVKDSNAKERSAATIQALQFHPNSQILMTAGFDKTVRLYNADGRHNELLQKVHLSNFPVYSSQFSVDGQQLFCTSRRPFFYTYDIVSGTIDRIHGLQGRREKSLESMTVSPDGKHLLFLGEAGSLLLVDATSLRLVQTLKMNGFAHASSLLTTVDEGEVYVWDIARRACIHRFKDDGCLRGTTIAAGGDYIACGSKSGIVNVYNSAVCLEHTHPKPIKSVMNLTTATDILAFNHDQQIMVMASKKQRDHLRMLHMPSLTVFRNWPTDSTPLRYVHCAAFSPNSGYLSLGNDRGHALLYRLNHYTVS